MRLFTSKNIVNERAKLFFDNSHGYISLGILSRRCYIWIINFTHFIGLNSGLRSTQKGLSA